MVLAWFALVMLKDKNNVFKTYAVHQLGKNFLARFVVSPACFRHYLQFWATIMVYLAKVYRFLKLKASFFTPNCHLNKNTIFSLS